ncbi:HDOD domain-containing protein [Thiocystis violacea]|uniref:HDOD domain-containing protein n=1 Tax=Thiocystis violacea TaxID=13725 RepID=UPI001903CD8F|nr:HDOD domain-containing protein [Thiocystis violacea]MBK1718227.1 histidine kinase [Thiocystis violacea]
MDIAPPLANDRGPDQGPKPLSADGFPKSHLDEWLETIRCQKMPIFDQTVHRIIAIAEDDRAPVSALAGVILQDASMTTRMLRLANSIFYNPSSTPISTVTRAVILLGFDSVRDMCLTLALVDNLVEGVAKERLERELARALHAATQARALANAHGDKSPEEVFIATLLYRVGELAFWCFGNEQCDRIEQLLQQPGMTPEEAQERVLGFRLSRLSRRLIHEWHLTTLLQEAIDYPARQDPRIQSVMLGQRIARCAEEQGWRSEAMEALIQKAAKLTDLSETEAKALIHERAQAAAMMACDCGATVAAALIPQPSNPRGTPAEAAAMEPPPEDVASPPADAYPRPDPKLQSRILRELASIIESDQCDFNVIMELVLEGLYRGLGMDRVVFALTTPDKQVIKAKCGLGVDEEALPQRFFFRRPAMGSDILFQTLDSGRPYLVTLREREDNPGLVPEGLTGLIGMAPFMVAPIIVNQQRIGIFLGDRGLSQRPLDPTCYEAFKHFVHQANLGLTQASKRHRR